MVNRQLIILKYLSKNYNEVEDSKKYRPLNEFLLRHGFTDIEAKKHLTILNDSRIPTVEPLNYIWVADVNPNFVASNKWRYLGGQIGGSLVGGTGLITLENTPIKAALTDKGFELLEKRETEKRRFWATIIVAGIAAIAAIYANIQGCNQSNTKEKPIQSMQTMPSITSDSHKTTTQLSRQVLKKGDSIK